MKIPKRLKKVDERIPLHRQRFTSSGAALRKERAEFLDKFYDLFFMPRLTQQERNAMIDELAIMLATNGLYARPLNFKPENPGSYKAIRQGIQKHFHRIWRCRRAEEGLPKSWRSWWNFCEVSTCIPMTGYFNESHAPCIQAR